MEIGWKLQIFTIDQSSKVNFFLQTLEWGAHFILKEKTGDEFPQKHCDLFLAFSFDYYEKVKFQFLDFLQS